MSAALNENAKITDRRTQKKTGLRIRSQKYLTGKQKGEHNSRSGEQKHQTGLNRRAKTPNKYCNHRTGARKYLTNQNITE